MALRGCVILLFVLLSGSVNADETAITLAPVMQEQSISQIPTVTQTDSPSSSVATTATTLSTTEAQTTLTTKAQTTLTTKAQTTLTTKAQTTITTKAQTTITTEAPTTHQNTTNSTTEAPTTTHHIPTTELPTTPHHNTTNSTTEAPTTAHTNATTAPTPPPTTPPVPKPTVGNYSVRPDVNSSTCLLAKMGLQFSFTSSGNASRHTINLDPNVTVASGTCGSGGSNSSLVLKSDKITVQFIFTNVSEKFRLNALVLSIGSIFNESNNNLSLWEVSIGSSYMCRKEQTYNISDKLTINTFELQVQPFAVQNDTFSTAHECSMDDISLLIPIIVGAVLAGLIFIVVIAYVIGRRRTYVGYQTL